MRGWAFVLCASAACQVSPKFAGLDEEVRQIHLDERIELTTLTNGMRVAVVPDARTNLVTIDVRYEVGAADDPPRRAGMAHYAEHVMWEAGVRGADGMPSLADATLSSNASTTHSSTAFTSLALDVDFDRALEIEARRLEIPCITLREELLARERDVVIEELKERSGLTPAMDGLAAAVWGPGHPYGRSAGGVEFAAAPSTELCAFVSGHYVPRVVTLVVTGNVPADARDRIAARFGRIPPRTPPARGVLVRLRSPHIAPIAPIAVDGLARPAVMVVIPVPPEGGPDDELVGIATQQARSLLAFAGLPSGDAFVLGDHRARVIVAHVEVDHAEDLDAIARAMSRALRPFARQDISDVMRARRTEFALEFDRLSDRGHRIADQVAMTGQASQYLRLAQLDAVTPDEVASILRSGSARIVKLVPGEGRTLGHRISNLTTTLHRLDVSRTPVDPVTATQPLPLPTRRIARRIEDYRLANGLRVVLAPDPQSIAVDARLVFPIGLDSDPEAQPRRAEWGAYLLRPDDGWNEGAYEHRLVTWYHRAVGDRPQVEVDGRSTTFRTTGFGVFADWHVWNIAWTVLHGAYPPALDQLARHGNANKRPRTKRLPHPLRILDRVLGDERDSARELSWVKRSELEHYRRAAYRPAGATLIISGQFEAPAMREEIEMLFGAWRADEAPAAKIAPRARAARTPRYFAIDDPAAIATQLVLAYVPRRAQTDEPPERASRETLSAILDDRMRIVREGLGVSYGIRGAVDANVIQITGSVDSAHVGHALAVIEAELLRLRATGPELAADFARARRLVLGRALADPSGASEHARSLERSVLRGAALDDSALLIDAIRTLALDDIARTAADLDPERRIVILRGPRASIETAFATLGIDRSHIEWALPE